MSVATVAEPETSADTLTLADIVRRIGNVPLERILWTPRPGLATEADQVRLVGGEPKRLVELVDGILVEKAMGQRESLFAATLNFLVMNFALPRNLGVIGTTDAIMRMVDGRNRLPDLYFTPWERLPSATAHLRPVAEYSGDLMVEILSEGNTPAEIRLKRREYFASGTRLVWIVDPDARTVAVFADPTDPDAQTILTAADTLTGEPVLPGFSLPLVNLFDNPQLNPRPDPTAGG